LKEGLGLPMEKHILEIKRAKKRCVGMGSFHSWRIEFDGHPLAATMDNYTTCIDGEMKETKPDYLVVLVWILAMARKINAFCDAEKVVGNAAAEYWLERFLWRCDCVLQWDSLQA
jgi:hypothetical protein